MVQEHKCSYEHKEIRIGQESPLGSDLGCQYLVLEELESDELDLELDYYEVDGQCWCEFHCPMLDKNNNPTEKAKWELESDEEKAFVKKFMGIIGYNETKDIASNEHQDYSGTIFPMEFNFQNVSIQNVATFENCCFS